MDYGYLHEYEDVVLRLDEPRSCQELWRLLKALGFTFDGEVFSFLRAKNSCLQIWQSETIASVYIYYTDKEIYDCDENWDALKIRYLLATQPRENISIFVSKISDLSSVLGLDVIYNDLHITIADLNTVLNAHANELSDHVAEPGTEEVAIIIESTYPRY